MSVIVDAVMPASPSRRSRSPTEYMTPADDTDGAARRIARVPALADE